MSIEPRNGMVAANSSLPLTLVLHPRAGGCLSSRLLCQFNSGGSLPLGVELEVAGSRIVVDDASVLFGLVRCGSSVSVRVTFSNPCDVRDLRLFLEIIPISMRYFFFEFIYMHAYI